MFQQRPKESHRGVPIPPRLDQDIEHVTVLVHSPPEILLAAVECDEQFVEVPRVALLTARLSQRGLAIGLGCSRAASSPSRISPASRKRSEGSTRNALRMTRWIECGTPGGRRSESSRSANSRCAR